MHNNDGRIAEILRSNEEIKAEMKKLREALEELSRGQQECLDSLDMINRVRDDVQAFEDRVRLFS